MARNGTYYRYLLYRRRRRSGNGKGLPKWLLALGLLGGLFAIALGVVAAAGYGVYRNYADGLIPPDEAIAQLPRGGARVLDRNGRLLYQYLDRTAGLYEPVPIQEVSFALIGATIATEDTTFWDNPGVNFRGLARAAWENFSPVGETPGFLKGTGGSSITQQLVKNIYFSPEEREKRTVTRKLKETVYALELTQRYEKLQILEWYLNQISYGGIYTGVEAASQGYFGKHAKDLTLAEAATLAGIPACPSCYDPITTPQAAVQRRNHVLARMVEEGMITPEQAFFAGLEPLKVTPQRFPVEAPHFVFTYVQPELERLFGEEALRRDGLVVYTSLDLDLQRRAEAILEEKISTYEYSNAHNGAVVAIDPKTAEILVLVGSRDYFREDIQGQVNNALAENSPGSAFKPFMYVTTFMNLGWGPGTMILDGPLPPGYWDGRRPPRNPVAHSGPITVRNALGNSLNVPAVKAILYAGVPNVIRQAKKMGITTLDNKQLGPSMTIGGVDVTLLDMVYGYTVFPNLGLLKGVPTTLDLPEGNRSLDPVAILRVEDRNGNVLYPREDGQPVTDRPFIQEERVVPPQEAYLITDILSDPQAQCLTFTCGGLTINRPMAVKTGTSEPYEDCAGCIGDTWAIAYTEDIIAGSWAGNADNEPMRNISSTSISWRTVRDFMIEYHEEKPVKRFTRPDGLVKAQVCIPSGLKPTKNCPRTTPEDWLPEHAVPQRDDDWWRVSGGRRFLQLPSDLPDFHRTQALEWARVIGSSVGSAPTETTGAEDIAVAIVSPANGSTVSGVVSITGRAQSSGFTSYRVDYQAEFAPGSWTLIANSANPVAEGTLALWDTASLPPGSYTIRLLLLDRQRGEIATQVTVQVGTAEPTPTAAPIDLPAPDTPQGRQHPGRGGGPPGGRGAR